MERSFVDGEDIDTSNIEQDFEDLLNRIMVHPIEHPQEALSRGNDIQESVPQRWSNVDAWGVQGSIPSRVGLIKIDTNSGR